MTRNNVVNTDGSIDWDKIGSFEARLANIVTDVKKFGAKGDGVTNDTVAIQNAINYLKSVGGGELFFPKGIYLYTELVVDFSNIFFNGEGASSILKQNIANEHGITFYNSSAILKNIRVSNLHFDSTITKTVGSCLTFLNIVDSHIDNCYFDNQYDGISIGTYQYLYVNNCIFRDIANRGIVGDFGDGLFLNSISMQNQSIVVSSVGIVCNNGNLNMIDVDITLFDYGLYSNPTVGQSCYWWFIEKCCFDTCNNGISLDNRTGGEIKSIDFTSCWFSTNNNRGIELYGVKGANFTNCRILNNGTDGVFIGGLNEDIEFNGCRITANGKVSTATNYGILSASGDFRVLNCLFSNDYAGISNYQKVGIKVIDGSFDYFDILNNKFKGQSVNDIENNSTGINFKIKNNSTDKSISVVATNNLILPIIGELFNITGTTDIWAIVYSYVGRKVTLKFTGITNVSDNSNLKLSSIFATSADDTLSLFCDGVNWIETSRSAN